MKAPAKGSPPEGPAPARRPAVTVLDLGAGNLRSVEKALERAGARVTVTEEAASARAGDGLVLPGVGAFPRAIARLRETGLDRVVGDAVGRGLPTLGICLGLQLLFESSDELGGAEGLGLLPGRVRALPAAGRKLPHIGWSAVSWERPDPLAEGLRPEEPFYFVHSFACEPRPEDRIGSASYGGTFACAAGRDNLHGVQFHPEKSGAAGLGLLRNFVRMCGDPQ